MKVSAGRAEAFAKNPDPKAQAVLVFGADEGLVRERTDFLVASVLEDPKDPFRLARLAGPELRKDPARLADEAAAMAMTGGRRVVVVEDAGDDSAPLFDALLAQDFGEALIVVRAGDLPARSALRKLFEKHAAAAALACYRDEAAGLSRLIREQLSADGLRITPEALAYLESQLGGDRQVSRRELEKLALYKGKVDEPISLEEAEACIGDSRLVTLDDVAMAVASGELAALERALTRCNHEGQSPISILRAVARHFERLHLVAGLLRQGEPLDGAMKRLRPPVFWKVAGAFKTQCKAWSPARLARALEELLQTEMACKETGQPAELLTARCLWALAANAPGRR